MAGHDSPSYSHWLTIATTIFLIWTILFVAVRLWAKLTKSLPWSFYDNLFAAAFVSVFVLPRRIMSTDSSYRAWASRSALRFMLRSRMVSESYTRTLLQRLNFGQKKYGIPSYLTDPQHSLTAIDQALYASQILYLLSIGISKSSTALFFGSLTRNKRQKWPSYAVAIVCGIWTLACILVIALRGNLAVPWLTENESETFVSRLSPTSSRRLTISQYVRWLGIEASGLCLELVLWSLSITLVWGLNTPLKKRLKVIGLFGLRLM
jgi:hypothetical protein